MKSILCPTDFSIVANRAIEAGIYLAKRFKAGLVLFHLITKEIDAGMITLATHGRSGFAHLLTGSVGEDVVNPARRPVITIKYWLTLNISSSQ